MNDWNTPLVLDPTKEHKILIFKKRKKEKTNNIYFT